MKLVRFEFGHVGSLSPGEERVVVAAVEEPLIARYLVIVATPPAESPTVVALGTIGAHASLSEPFPFTAQLIGLDASRDLDGVLVRSIEAPGLVLLPALPAVLRVRNDGPVALPAGGLALLCVRPP